MLHGMSDFEKYPPEFREALKEYMKKLSEGGR